jgi:hypothetical protein
MIRNKNGFIKIVPREQRCCNLPSLGDINETETNVGSIWRCPKCGLRWKITRIIEGGRISEGIYELGGINWERQKGGFGDYMGRLFDALLGL